MSGIELIVQERNKQLQHGYTADHDKKYDDGALLVLAEFLMKGEDDAEKDNLGHELVSSMGFEQEYIAKLWKLPRKRQLTIAAALIAAEIDRDDESIPKHEVVLDGKYHVLWSCTGNGITELSNNMTDNIISQIQKGQYDGVDGDLIWQCQKID